MVIALAGINPWKDGYLQINIITWRKKMFFRLLRGIKNGHWTPLNKYRQTGTKGGGGRGIFPFSSRLTEKIPVKERRRDCFLLNTPWWCCLPLPAHVLWWSLTKVIKLGKKKDFVMPQLQGLGKNCVWPPRRLQTHLRATSHHLSHQCWGARWLGAMWGWRVFNAPELTTTAEDER